MKLAFFDNYKLGVVVGDKIVDVSAVTKGIKALGPQDVIRGVIEKWSTYKGKLAAAAKKGKGKPLAKVKLRPPLPKPENIICMAVNYMEDGTLAEPAASRDAGIVRCNRVCPDRGVGTTRCGRRRNRA